MSSAMQRPTLTNVHIRSAADAHKLFYAVQLGLLPKIEKRLDANERAALRPGDVYVWEEKGPNTDSFSVSMERFTEGKSWTASRVREDFLMYFESPRKGKGNARTSENQVVRPGEQDLYIKLTYSVIREDVKEASQSKDAADKLKKPPKWHMNAYFTKLTEGQLRTIDDIPMLRDLVVPEGIFSSARTSKPGKRSDGSRNANSTVKRMYAPFPPHPTRRVRSSDTPPPLSVPPGTSSATSAAVILNSAPDALLPPPPPLPAGSVPLHPPNVHHTSAVLPFFPTSEQQQSNSLSHALSERPLLPDGVKPLLSSPSSSLASYSPVDAVTQPMPHYGWTTESGYAASTHAQRRLSHSNSPSFSDRSSSRSAPSPMHMSPALSSASTSSQESPMLAAATPPLWDNGEPYKPAPILPLASNDDMHTPRVPLVPLETLPRSHVYRRSPTDDRALRLLALGPGAR
ncbi:Gti1/Pac2 family-domain-containing protein [Cubamyces lactineus]|nr:Gti1/Pac2 family-domain-containing protein [Cubamyces lactineus]